jgi:hypothetical protein
MKAVKAHRGIGAAGAVMPPPFVYFQFGVYHTESRGRQAMGVEQMDYAAIVADLEAKRNALDQTIAAFRTAHALGALGQTGELPPPPNGLVPNVFGPSTFVPSASGGEVPAGAFLRKSIPDATKLYLEIVKKKQTSKEIADALQKGGMETNSKNFPQMVHSVLDRASKASSGIVKLDRSHWGLAAWYPPSLRTAGKVQGRGAGRKKAKKAKAKMPATPQAKESVYAAGSEMPMPGLQPSPKANERALRFLHGKPFSEHSLADVGAQIGVGIKGTRLILGKLVKAGKVRMSAPGMYTIVPFASERAS